MKVFLIVGWMSVLGFHQIQAQSFYQSKDFERRGVTEYIKIMWAEHVFYWTNVNKKEISLTNHHNGIAEDVSDGRLYEVSFPNSKKTYRLHEVTQGQSKLICTHPDGRVQVFEALPVLYRSKNFEKPGVTEYLTYDDSDSEGLSLLYFTSKNQRKKIKLIRVRNERLKYRFPGGKAIYKLIPEGVCLGGIRCIHPDGRIQYFEFYQWKD